MRSTRVENMDKYKEEIFARPKKTWIQNSKEKQSLQEESKKRLEGGIEANMKTTQVKKDLKKKGAPVKKLTKEQVAKNEADTKQRRSAKRQKAKGKGQRTGAGFEGEDNEEVATFKKPHRQKKKIAAGTGKRAAAKKKIAKGAQPRPRGKPRSAGKKQRGR